MSTSRVKPSEESWAPISSDYRRWCHAPWQLRVLSTLSRLPAAPAGSGSPPSPSVHLVGRSLRFSEPAEMIYWIKKVLILQTLSVDFLTLFFYEAAGLCRSHWVLLGSLLCCCGHEWTFFSSWSLPHCWSLTQLSVSHIELNSSLPVWYLFFFVLYSANPVFLIGWKTKRNLSLYNR